MTKEEDFIKLEGIVINLMERYNALKIQKFDLDAQVKAKDVEISELTNVIESLQDEKSKVHGRVTTLLGSIEEWEKTLDGDVQSEGQNVYQHADDHDPSEDETNGNEEGSEPRLF